MENAGDKHMNWDRLENRWNDFAGSARAHWSKLTDDDWLAITGTKGHLIGRIQKRYGVAREEAERQVDAWSGALLDVVETSPTH
jgi:uncharacterized protein YjbJ (UPF0337 family)